MSYEGDRGVWGDKDPSQDNVYLIMNYFSEGSLDVESERKADSYE